MLQPGQTTIRRVRLAHRDRNIVGPLERAMSRMNLHPAALPHAAILCVRYLQAPLAQLDVHARHELDRLTREAARPILGAVPPHAAAVLFMDRAEMLACLAVDWLAGRVAECWWWNALLPGGRGDTDAAVHKVWLDAAECAPAALDTLDRRRLAPDVAHALAPVALLLLQRIFHAFGLQLDVSDAFDVEPREPSTEWSDTTGRFVRLPREAPWHSWMPDTEISALALEQQALVGIGLGLRRAPTHVASRAFATALAEWRATRPANQPATAMHQARFAVRTLLTPSPPSAPSSTPSLDFDPPITPCTSDESVAESVTRDSPVAPVAEPASGSRPARPSAPPPETVDASVRQSPAVHTAAPGAETNSRLVPIVSAVRAHDPIDAPRAAVETVDPVNAAAASEGAQDPAPVDPLVSVTPSPETVRTDYGGILFLINVAISMGLYADFTRPGSTGLSLSIWDLLALLGDQLLDGKVRQDPLWDVLANLAGRPPDAAPAMFGHRWLRRLARRVRARLAQALVPQPPDTPESVLLARSATIEVSVTRVDAIFALDDLPIEVRRAGLDRDPGWVPAAGRYIAFQFD